MQRHRFCTTVNATLERIEDVLAGGGVNYEIAHNMHLGESERCIASRTEVVRMARRFERAIPGHPYR